MLKYDILTSAAPAHRAGAARNAAPAAKVWRAVHARRTRIIVIRKLFV